MKKLILTLVMSVAASTMSLFAVPAKPTPIPFTQPDGTTIMLRLVGDERSHMILTPEGYPVTRDVAGYYCFASVDENGGIKPTSVRAEVVSKLNSAERAIIGEIDPSLVRKALSARGSKRKTAPAKAANTHSGIGLMNDSFLGYKDLKGLVILAQFSDKKFSSTCDNEFFTNMLNQEGFSQFNGTGSARDFFIDSSNGAFVPHFDVYGPVTLPNKMAYYGGNDNSGNDLRPGEMIRDACKGLDGQINFKDYDIDGDGYVDNVFVFYAGYGEASYDDDNTIWPHQWELSAQGIPLTLDGVKIDRYACSNELGLDDSKKVRPDGVGTFVHEFSHVIGLPDLYVTTSSGGEWTPGEWSVMDMGPYNNDGRTPPSYSSYERNALGWVDLVEITGPDNIRLESLTGSNKACIIPTSKQNEFFLLENRQKEGWDKYIPGHGMLIWHIDYNKSIWYNNEVNNTQSHNYVDIEEASGTYRGSAAAYTFPGTKNVTSFTDDTKPSMKTWSGARLGLPITDIAENNGVISFKVAGGRSEADVPEIKAPAEVGQDWFVASWNSSNGAVSYILTVEKNVGSGAVTSETTDFGNDTSEATLPEGWTFEGMTTGGVYASSGNYGASAPSLKLDKTGRGFTTREFSSDISEISFWLKGQGTDKDGGSYLNIEGFLNGSWELIKKVIPLQNKVSNETIEVPSCIRQIKVTYNKKIGNVAIDDFTVTFDGGIVVFDGYDGKDVGNVTSHCVNGVSFDGVISYKVCAVDANGVRSDFSESQIVNDANSGIEPIVVGKETNVAVDGNAIIVKTVADASIVLYDLSGHVVSCSVADAHGCGVVYASAPGLYIVVTPGHSEKIIIK